MNLSINSISTESTMEVFSSANPVAQKKLKPSTNSKEFTTLSFLISKESKTFNELKVS